MLVSRKKGEERQKSGEKNQSGTGCQRQNKLRGWYVNTVNCQDGNSFESTVSNKQLAISYWSK